MSEDPQAAARAVRVITWNGTHRLAFADGSWTRGHWLDRADAEASAARVRAELECAPLDAVAPYRWLNPPA